MPAAAPPSSIRWDLSGQVALVTGGTRGIGAAISSALLAAGARVCALYRADAARAAAFAESCAPTARALPAGDPPGNSPRARLELAALDVADGDAVQRFFASWQGPLHVLVNNAGVRDDALLGMMSPQAWERVLAVNLGGAFHMAKHAVRLMIGQRYGRIVNISSPAATHGLAGQANYAASKAGLEAMTRSLCREVAGRGITVNCVCAGLMQTELLAGLSAERLAALLREVPLGRFASGAELAAAVLFLASPEASYITGSTLRATGGL